MDHKELLIKYLLYFANPCQCEICKEIYHVDKIFTEEEKNELTTLNKEAHKRIRTEYDARPENEGLTEEEITDKAID